MKVLLSWIEEFVDLSNVSLKEISDKLTESGFEVEDIIRADKGLDNVISAQICKISKHPNADKLVICDTNTGSGHLQIVTGATNMKEGDIVALALNNSSLPCGAQIKSGIIRGEKSEGMFCGGEELGIDNSIYPNAEVYGLLILNPETPLGLPMGRVLGLDEVILDINVLPNRPDCNSVYGIAKEISAVLNLPLKPLDLSYKTSSSTKSVEIKIEDYDLCKRYISTVIEETENAQTPSWMKKRLSLLGHVPHNFYVDLTNYILLEIGQPMHTFDLSKIDRNKIIVRRARENETILTLDKKTHKLSNENLVIADASKPLVIAGIMGGEDSGTFSSTKNVMLESAIFDYANVRRTSRALGISSDSSVRFAKNVYFDSAMIGMKRALHLICKCNAGEISRVTVDNFKTAPVPKIVRSSAQDIRSKLAINLSGEQMVDILNRLNIETNCIGDQLISKVPTDRIDIERQCDIMEEIGRLYGLNNIDINKTSNANFMSVGEILQSQKNLNIIRNATANEGFNEMISYQFISPKIIQDINQDPDQCIKLLNPLGYDYSIMRKTLIPSMLNAISYNQKQGNKNLYLFELARVFIPKELPLTELPAEPNYLCVSMNAENEDFYSLKNSLTKICQHLGVKLDYKQSTCEYMHPGICADVMLYNRKIGVIGQVHPTVQSRFEISKQTFIAEIDTTKLLDRDAFAKTVVPLPKLPDVERDLALLVEEDVPVGDLLTTINRMKTEISSASIFDVYVGSQIQKGLKSVAIRIQIKQNDKTLTEQEISLIIEKVLRNEAKDNGAKLR